jgi:hypothetical protein
MANGSQVKLQYVVELQQQHRRKMLLKYATEFRQVILAGYMQL